MKDNRQSKEIFIDTVGFLKLKGWDDIDAGYSGLDIYDQDENFIGEIPGISINDKNEIIETAILDWWDTFTIK